VVAARGVFAPGDLIDNDKISRCEVVRMTDIVDGQPDRSCCERCTCRECQAAVRGAPATAELSVFDRTFPARVAVLMRSRPITEAIVGASRQEWPAGSYDIATFALAAIDLVIAEQGFEEEATYDEVVDGLAGLARRSAPDRPGAEHRRVGEYTVDALLNRGEREAPFTYRISDFTDEARIHQRRQVCTRPAASRSHALPDRAV
jgi:hypothetical protein